MCMNRQEQQSFLKLMIKNMFEIDTTTCKRRELFLIIWPNISQLCFNEILYELKTLLSQVVLPHPVYTCLYCNAMHFWRAYVANYNRCRLFKNVFECGKRIRKQDVATGISSLSTLFRTSKFKFFFLLWNEKWKRTWFIVLASAHPCVTWPRTYFVSLKLFREKNWNIIFKNVKFDLAS